jgi:hypothetical protein
MIVTTEDLRKAKERHRTPSGRKRRKIIFPPDFQDRVKNVCKAADELLEFLNTKK